MNGFFETRGYKFASFEGRWRSVFHALTRVRTMKKHFECGKTRQSHAKGNFYFLPFLALSIGDEELFGDDSRGKVGIEDCSFCAFSLYLSLFITNFLTLSHARYHKLLNKIDC